MKAPHHATLTVVRPCLSTALIGEIPIWAVREQRHHPPLEVTPGTPAAERKGGREHPGHFRSETDTGTGYGKELVDHVRPTEFIRSSSVRCLTFRYGLTRAIAPRPRHPAKPAEPFAPPPPGWAGRRR